MTADTADSTGPHRQHMLATIAAQLEALINDFRQITLPDDDPEARRRIETLDYSLVAARDAAQAAVTADKSRQRRQSRQGRLRRLT